MAGVVTLVVLGAAAAGCGGDGVHVGGSAPAARDRAQCRALLDDLPATVDDLARRTVSGSRYAAAWGDPAIVLRCGVGEPEGFDRFSRCQRANGVDWFVPESTIGDLRSDAVMTTVGRSPAIEVTLPARYRPAGSAAAMVDLAPTIKRHTTRTTPCA